MARQSQEMMDKLKNGPKKKQGLLKNKTEVFILSYLKHSLSFILEKSL